MELYPDERPIAKCYLKKGSDEKNACYLTDQRLVIINNEIFSEFTNDNIRSISIEQKKLLVPIIAGGIGLSLSLLALLNNIYNPYLLLLITFAGVGLMYYGFNGTPAISINYGGKEFNILIRNATTNLSAFVNYTASQISSGHSMKNNFFKLINIRKWEEISSKKFFFKPGAFLTFAQMKRLLKTYDHQNDVVIMIDPLVLSEEIRFKTTVNEKDLIPYIENDIPLDQLAQVNKDLFKP